ncbi:MAG: hypothetical protein D6761_01450 [Candidatus Dadabacteria bacterium]|nr:MAG: hypothetical protein D6761_01450 [Candidatus Dadabacteria bacterium]
MGHGQPRSARRTTVVHPFQLGQRKEHRTLGSHRYRPVVRRLRRIAVLPLALLVSGCSTAGYLAHVAAGELRILLRREPIDQAVRDRRFSAEQRRKMLLIRDAAADAEAQLGLARAHQYREVARLPDDFDVWVIAIAEPDRLETVYWEFPIAGRVPYLGFFDRARAEDYVADHFPDKDHYLRTASAFSTLGWLPDPVLPAFFRLPDDAIVNTVVHELVHATVYAPGHSDWNESVATALGDAGALLLLRDADPELARVLEARLADRRLWRDLVDRTIRDLETAYAATTTAEARLQIKARVIAKLKQEIADAPWSQEGYRRLAEAPINHAFLLAHHVYGAHPEWQEHLFRLALSDYRGTINRLRCLTRDVTDETDLWPERLPDCDKQ